jgi:hypothetical protein
MAYKSAAFEVSEEDLVFGGGGYKNMIAVEKQETETWLENSDDDEEMPDAASLVRKLREGKQGDESVSGMPHRYVLPIQTGLFLRQRKAPISSQPISSQPSFTSSFSSDDSGATNLQRWKNPKTPSAKLVALVRFLKSWESNIETAMDKVIIYSQCMGLYM